MSRIIGVLACLAALGLFWVKASGQNPGATGGVNSAESPKASQENPPPASGAMPWRLGLWLWASGPFLQPEAGDQLLDFCAKHGIDILLAQIHFQDAEKRDSLLPGYADFLRKAAQQDLRVEALEGEPEMAFASLRADTLQRLDSILNFDLALPPHERFSGLHYDIEFTSSPRWRTHPDPADRQAMMREVLETAQAIQDKIKTRAPELTVAYDLPQAYGVQADDFTLSFHGKTAPIYQHLQDLSDYVVVMSYRQRGTGENSVVSMATPEIIYAAQIGKTACISLDTEQSKDEPNTTFYGKSAATLEQTAAESLRALGDRPGFGGLYLHHYGSLETILGQATPFRHEVDARVTPTLP